MPAPFFLAAYLFSATQSAPTLGCADLPSLFESFLRIHYASPQVSELATTRSVEEFIRSIDPSRTLLLEAEVETLRRDLPGVMKSMKFGSCSLLEDAAMIAVKRVEEDEKFVRQLLSKKTFKVDRGVEIVLDPKKRGYAKSPKMRRALVKKMVHFQVASYLVAGNDLETAKKRLVHRYELATKRQREYLSDSELPSLFAEAYAGSLDPHSTFFTARSLEDFQIHMRLSLEGIGAVLRSEDGFTVIQSLVPGGQADKQGILRPQDKVMAVAQDGESPVDVFDMALRDVVELIRGKKGTKVTLTVLREGKTTETLQVTIVRDQIDVKEQAAKISYVTKKFGCDDPAGSLSESPAQGPQVGQAPQVEQSPQVGQAAAVKPQTAQPKAAAPASKSPPGSTSAAGPGTVPSSGVASSPCDKQRPLKVGIIDLPSFYGGDERGRSSYRDVKQLLEEAVTEKVDAVVLDLSKNGGGLLKDAVNISGLFLKSGAIVATKSFDDEVEVLEDEDESVAYSGPLVILASPLSASGAEILAGALKDYRRAVVVGGDHTFGKGTVQVLNTLPTGVGAIKVTTGMFFLPSGGTTQQLGVESDVRVPSVLNRKDIGEKELEYSLKPEAIRGFASGDVNATEANRRWTPMDAGLIATLKERSSARVAKSLLLQKLTREMEDEDSKRGVVRVSEMLADAKKKNAESSKDEVEAMESAFLAEGTHVAADLVGLISERQATLATPAPK